MSVGQIEHPYNLFPFYRIVPGDVLDVLFQIRTWTERETFTLDVDHTLDIKFVHAPELNQSQTVRPDGKITLPYVGEVYVVGKTIDELTTELKVAYNRVLKKPDLFIVVPEFRSAIKELKKDLHTAPRGLSRLVTVRPDGYVTFPMVGDVFVANRTIPEVNKELNQMYEGVLQELHVDLFLEEHAGSVVYVLGQVKNPGAYKVVKPISIIEAATLAGGFSYGPELRSVIVIRKHDTVLVATRVDLGSTLNMSTATKLMYLQPDDIVYVPKRFITSAAEIANDIADMLMFRGWNVGFSWELHDVVGDDDDPF
jgi:polysaccharide export outer membrane protein